MVPNPATGSPDKTQNSSIRISSWCTLMSPETSVPVVCNDETCQPPCAPTTARLIRRRSERPRCLLFTHRQAWPNKPSKHHPPCVWLAISPPFVCRSRQVGIIIEIYANGMEIHTADRRTERETRPVDLRGPVMRQPTHWLTHHLCLSQKNSLKVHVCTCAIVCVQDVRARFVPG